MTTITQKQLEQLRKETRDGMVANLREADQAVHRGHFLAATALYSLAARQALDLGDVGVARSTCASARQAIVAAEARLADAPGGLVP